MPTNYYHRQSILERALRILFTTDKDHISIESSDLDKDHKAFNKMLNRRGVNNSVKISKDRDRGNLIFKIK